MQPPSPKLIGLALVSVTLGSLLGPRFQGPDGDRSGRRGPSDRSPFATVGVPIDALPFTIERGGLYFVTSSLTGAPGETGISVSADDVTIDLRGFTLTGGAGSLDGIFVTLPHENLTVHGGTLRGWGGSGVDASQSYNAHFRDLHLLGNALSGLTAGRNALVSDCTARGNGQVGISAADNSSISRCTTTENGFTGLMAGESCSVTDCSSRTNDVGFSVTRASVVNCTAVKNQRTGFAVSGTSTVRDCVANFNGADGFSAGADVSISGCIADQNYGNGITAGSRSVIRDNNCMLNRKDGTAAGILCSSFDSRVEGNHVTVNDIGIAAPGPGSLFIKNSASGNTTDYSIGPGNAMAQIVDVSAGGVFEDADPMANLVH